MVDEIRTEPITIVTRGSIGNEILGSATIPKDKVGQLTLRNIFARGSAEFALTDKSGTVGMTYLEAAGAEVLQGDITKPISSLKAGSVRIRKINGGSVVVGCELRIDLV